MSSIYPDLPVDISSSITQISGTVIDQADDGTPWIRNYYKEPVYNITIDHTMISIDQINLLKSFYDSNYTSPISLLFKIDNNLYDCYFAGPVQVIRNDPYNWTARSTLIGTTWNPSRLFKGKTGFYFDINNLSTLTNNTGSNVTVEDSISKILDLSGNGFNGIQTNETSMSKLKMDSNGAYYLDFDGSNNHYLIDNINTNTGDHSAIFIYDPDDSLDQQNTPERWLLDSLTGRLVLGERAGDSPRKLGFYSSSNWKQIANPINTPQVVSFIFSGTTGYIYRNGSLVGTGVYTPVGLGGATVLGGNNLGTFFFVFLKFYSCIVLEGALSNTDRVKTENFLKARAKFA